jgi:hypothetical protein
VFRPTELFSAGLTNSPHLPVQYLNDQNQNQQVMKKDKVIQLLAAVGILTAKGVAFANDASDEDVEKGLEQLGDKAKGAAAFANEKAQLESKVTAETSKVNALTSEKTTLVSERDAARTQFANERAARIEDSLGHAIVTGRITDAERPVWKGRLENQAQFANELGALTNLEPKIKTASAVEGRTKVNGEIADPNERRQFVNEAIDSVCREKGWDRTKDYDKAFNHVQKAHPAMFAAMAKPELAGKKTARNGN